MFENKNHCPQGACKSTKKKKRSYIAPERNLGYWILDIAHAACLPACLCRSGAAACPLYGINQAPGLQEV